MIFDERNSRGWVGFIARESVSFSDPGGYLRCHEECYVWRCEAEHVLGPSAYRGPSHQNKWFVHAGPMSLAIIPLECSYPRSHNQAWRGGTSALDSAGQKPDARHQPQGAKPQRHQGTRAQGICDFEKKSGKIEVEFQETANAIF